ITLKGVLEVFLAEDGLKQLRRFLAQRGVTDVVIVRVESGSVKLTLSLPEDQAERLSWLADSGELDRFGLLGLKSMPLEHEVPATISCFDLEDYHKYMPLEHEVPATISCFDLEDYHRYLLHRAMFLLGDPRVPVGLDAAELASETLRSAYGTAE